MKPANEQKSSSDANMKNKVPSGRAGGSTSGVGLNTQATLLMGIRAKWDQFSEKLKPKR